MKIPKKLIKEINNKILRYWQEPKPVKPDVMKLYLEMKDDPKWKGKIWHPKLNCSKLQV